MFVETLLTCMLTRVQMLPPHLLHRKTLDSNVTSRHRCLHGRWRLLVSYLSCLRVDWRNIRTLKTPEGAALCWINFLCLKVCRWVRTLRPGLAPNRKGLNSTLGDVSVWGPLHQLVQLSPYRCPSLGGIGCYDLRENRWDEMVLSNSSLKRAVTTRPIYDCD